MGLRSIPLLPGRTYQCSYKFYVAPSNPASLTLYTFQLVLGGSTLVATQAVTSSGGSWLTVSGPTTIPAGATGQYALSLGITRSNLGVVGQTAAIGVDNLQCLSELACPSSSTMDSKS
jgi:hypothetical protein